ncbi:MAG: protein kinase [Candidatus Sumerlaeota bacterium]|nr:protein kinase [Candidatus Sumerlaeota bacterium]
MLPSLEALRERFPQFEILELLGRGGMGAVYKARQPQLDRIVALKILLPDIGRDPAFAERFATEARALARLNHPNIITIHDFGQADGLFYFVMEYVDGMSLRQLLEAERVSAREALAIVPQICDALQFAHDHGIIHRDIKPENILLDRLGRVKVADFGLAKLMSGGAGGPAVRGAQSPSQGAAAAGQGAVSSGQGGESSGEGGAAAMSFPLTEAGKVMGTPQYMAPEQIDRPREVDHRADIYALGVVFYQMLTGELPEQRIEPPSHKVRIDVRLDEVVLRALEKQPERRYQQVSEIKTRVETIVSTESDSAPQAGKTTPDTQTSKGVYARRRTKGEFFGIGCAVQAIGLACFFIPYVGFALGVILLIIGGRLALKQVCSECGHRITDEAKTCAACGARFEQCFSRLAIAGAIWGGIGLLAVGLGIVFKSTLDIILKSTGSSNETMLFLLSLTAPFGMTILGWVAVAQIRRSARRLCGLGLAVFDGMLFPLLALDGLIGYCGINLARLCVSLFANPALQNRPEVNPVFITKVANHLAEHNMLPILAAILIALAVDYFIIRGVWRVVSRPSGDVTGEGSIPASTGQPSAPSLFAGILLNSWLQYAGLIILIGGLGWTYLWRDDPVEGRLMRPAGAVIAVIGLFAMLWGLLARSNAMRDHRPPSEIPPRVASAGAVPAAAPLASLWKDYALALLSMLPIVASWWFCMVFLVPKLYEVAKDAGIPIGSGAANLKNLVFSIFNPAAWLISPALLILFTFGELAIPAWRKHRRAALRLIVAAINGIILLGLLGVITFALMIAPSMRSIANAAGKANRSGAAATSATAAQEMSFGQVMERVLPSGAPCREQYFQFQNGNIYIVGNGPATTKEEYDKDWKQVEDGGGIDITAGCGADHIQLVGSGCVFTRDVYGLNWESTTADTAMKLMNHASFSYGVLELNKKELPVTYLFRTSRGETGIMQILDVVEDERAYHGEGYKGYGMKFRYKLTQPSQPSGKNSPRAAGLKDELLRTQLRQAQEALTIAEKKFAVGIVSNDDVITAKEKADTLKAEIDDDLARIARVRLEASLRRLASAEARFKAGILEESKYREAKNEVELRQIEYNAANAGATTETGKLPKQDGKSANGLRMECSSGNKSFSSFGDEIAWIRCRFTNTTSETKPITWSIGCGNNFCLLRSPDPFGCTLLPVPELDSEKSFVIKDGRPPAVEKILYLPPGESVGFRLITVPYYEPQTFTGRVAYDPLPPREGWSIPATGANLQALLPWTDQMIISAPFAMVIRDAFPESATSGAARKVYINEVIERELSRAYPERRTMNLCTNGYAKLPPGCALDFGPDGKKSLRAAGADIYVPDNAISSDTVALLDARLCVNLQPQAAGASSLSVDDVTTAQIEQILTVMEQWRSTMESANIPGMDLRRETNTISGKNLHFIITRNGARCALQITGATDKGVKIRYRNIGYW